MLRFDGRVALVTGGGRGMGRSHALLLADRGAKLVVNDYGAGTDGTGERSAAPAEAVVKEIRDLGGEAIADANTIATSTGGRAAVDAAVQTWGGLDIIVHNAGIGRAITEVDRIPDDLLERVVATHLLGAFHVIRPAWAMMRAQRYGRIVLVSSGTALGIAYSFDYAAAKGGLMSLARCLAVAGATSGITANAIMPVAFSRLIAEIPSADVQRRIEQHFKPEQVSPVVAWLAHEATDVTGETFSVGGGRVARVFIGSVPGYQNPDLTPEDVAAHAQDAMDVTDFVVLRNSTDDGALVHVPTK